MFSGVSVCYFFCKQGNRHVIIIYVIGQSQVTCRPLTPARAQPSPTIKGLPGLIKSPLTIMGHPSPDPHTCSNLFNLDLTTEGLPNLDCQQAVG